MKMHGRGGGMVFEDTGGASMARVRVLGSSQVSARSEWARELLQTR